MRRILIVFVAALGLVLGVGVTSTQANVVGYDGCTPGYWKNHTDNWEEADPDDLVSAHFATVTLPADTTMLQALSLPGGSGVEGAERILIRAAVASYLNAAHDGLGFPWRRVGPGLDGRPGLVSTVNAAIASGDRATMLTLAAWLDDDNNSYCPLN